MLLSQWCNTLILIHKHTNTKNITNTYWENSQLDPVRNTLSDTFGVDWDYIYQYLFLFYLQLTVSSAHQGCIYLSKNTVKTVKLINIITFKKAVFYVNIC